jgi:Ribbon-helix-helix protein, copG family
MRRTNIYLDESQTAALDEIAQAEGISRAAAIRRILDRAIGAAESSRDADLSAIEDSFGILDGMDELLRDVDDRALHLDRIRRA